MAQFAVIHIQKGKGSGAGIGNHISRKKITTNIDPTKIKDNMYFLKETLQVPLQERIKKRITDGYKGKKEIRKDAVKYLNIVLTGSKTKMHEICQTKNGEFAWVKANLEFIINRYGRENIVEFALHKDETTPHLHCVVVPLTKDGRLSAKEIMGNKNDLKALQDDYFKKMEGFGLERGVRGSKAKHETLNEFGERLNRTMDELKNLSREQLLELQRKRELRAQMKEGRPEKKGYKRGEQQGF